MISEIFVDRKKVQYSLYMYTVQCTDKRKCREMKQQLTEFSREILMIFHHSAQK